ncbi:hypothetical protein PoB_000353900 [Plakobranchus ocellatus]|uniref:Uncharacterized protein n=1 Tax=Plakobranchus ocellatus TaxID=259542 RepID=A0AAV3Y4P0_9GAST|nr:hypothetical protein PoB_000353900 [Plakobranchus ocellatus]
MVVYSVQTPSNGYQKETLQEKRRKRGRGQEVQRRISNRQVRKLDQATPSTGQSLDENKVDTGTRRKTAFRRQRRGQVQAKVEKTDNRRQDVDGYIEDYEDKDDMDTNHDSTNDNQDLKVCAAGWPDKQSRREKDHWRSLKDLKTTLTFLNETDGYKTVVLKVGKSGHDLMVLNGEEQFG